MNNKSGLFPAGRAVLVMPYTPEQKASMIELPDSVKSNQAMLEQRAVVIATGHSAWCDELQPRAKPGDKVLISAFAGYLAQGPLDGKQYRLVNDRDIFALISDNYEVE